MSRPSRARGRRTATTATPDATYGYPVDPASKDAKHSTRWHWGVAPGQVVEWHDPALPSRLIQIGNLVELRVAPGATGPWRRAIAFRPLRAHHVAFDPRPGRYQRIYLLITAVSRRRSGRWFDPETARPLWEWANVVGGKQAHAGRYTAIRVSPVGYLTDITYQTKKLGDDCKKVDGQIVGPGSKYIHNMGEDGGRRPLLCVSADGRLWIAGGSYTAPTPGIMR